MQIVTDQMHGHPLNDLQPCLETRDFLAMREAVEQVHCSHELQRYIVRLMRETRHLEGVMLGASPRATLALYWASQAWAGIQGRDYVLPDDVKFLSPHVLTHRLMISPQAQLRGRLPDELVADIVEAVPVPVEG